MWICKACGFDSAQEGVACPMCGAEEGFAPEDAPTLDFDHSEGYPPLVGRYEVGHLYAKRYRVEAVLGEGGMGVVYRVFDTERRQSVALKVLSAPSRAREEHTRRFKREVYLLARLQHPAIPRFLGGGSQGPELYCVTELVEGSNLSEALAESGPWAAGDAAALVATVADALSVAHRAGVIHRDVKPHNIMLGDDGAVFLIDFGIARARDPELTTLTKTGMLIGTPEYMSPEQLDGRPVDERTDIYSLGVMLFELLTGRRPFIGDTPISVAHAHLFEAPPKPRGLRPDLPAWIERLVLRCLEKDPGNRFDSAEDLATMLRKPRREEALRRLMPSGELVVEDDAGDSGWLLEIRSPRRHADWSLGMALHFEERFFELGAIVEPGADEPLWCYQFSQWPAESIFRKLVDFDVESTAAPRKPVSGGRLRQLIDRFRR